MVAQDAVCSNASKDAATMTLGVIMIFLQQNNHIYLTLFAIQWQQIRKANKDEAETKLQR